MHCRLFKSAALLAIMVAASAAPASADEATKKPHMVILATAKDLAKAQGEVNRAAERLGYTIAMDTFRQPPRRRVYVGHVLTLQKTAADRFVVTSFLGDEAEAAVALAEAKKHFPEAQSIAVVLPKGSDEAAEEWTGQPYARLGIVIVGSFKAYASALRTAKRFSKRSGYPYSARGMVYDKSRGLIWPDDSEDETWAGAYAPRRNDEECWMTPSGPCVTVEKSEAYEGFKPGFYIVVAGVVGQEERSSRQAFARKFAPSAYVKQTTIYLGCMH